MFKEQNIFGNGELFEAKDVEGTIYCSCTACMSIWAEFLSWANAVGRDRFVNDPLEADNIIVLSCQVTDLAVLNDIEELERLKALAHERAALWIGGCLARRFDIALPEGVGRLDHIRADHQPIYTDDMIHYAPPFWVKDFKEDDGAYAKGHLFRRMYPLRVSVGCTKNCEYCTIKTTRGKPYELDAFALMREWQMAAHQDVVLIADSPSNKVIRDWCLIAAASQKQISIRNVEPQVAVRSWDELLYLAKQGLLKVLHVPIQSACAEVLEAMRRPVEPTLEFVKKVPELRKYGVRVATNVIINYKSMEDHSLESYNAWFDYVSWNPYWDGVWDRNKAESRFKRYFGGR